MTKPSYKQKPLPQPPEREGSSMDVTCYECGQLGHTQTNCPRLTTKVSTVAVRTDGTVDPSLDPQDEEVLPPIKEGEGEISDIKNNLMNMWKYHSINGILRKKRRQKTILFPTGPT